MSGRGQRTRIAKYPGTSLEAGRMLLIGSTLVLTLLLAAAGTATLRGEEPAKDAAKLGAAEQAAEKLVLDALQARLHGQEERCRALLDEALEIVPDYPRALWLSGHVRERDGWVAVDEHQQSAAGSSLLDRYEEMRQQAIRNPKRELTLARWCDRMGLTAQRDLHYGRLLSSGGLTENQAKEAVRTLDLELAGGQFWSKEELSRVQARAASAMASLQKWLPQLAELEKGLHSAEPAEQAEARRRLRAVNEPEIVPALEAVMPVAGEPLALEAVNILGRNRAFESTLALTRYAILAPSDSVRQAATAELGRRPLHEFVPFLLSSLSAPLKSQFAIARGRDGSIQYHHLFLQQGREANSIVQARSASFPVARPENVTVVENAPVSRNRTVITRVDREAAHLATLGNVAQAAVREIHLSRNNAVVQQQNARIFPVLQAVTGQQLPYEPIHWWQWWEQYNETPQPRRTQLLTFSEQSTHTINYDATRYIRPKGSCFAPGTPVWTERGLRPIESILPGDRVLSQHPDTGELSYKVVISPTAASPGSGMSQLRLGEEDIHITHAHVVWVHGKGWEIVRRIKPGDILASLSGSTTIRGMADRPVTRLVHNLVVEDFHTFFVGREGLLVHDITYMTFRQPTQAVVPGLLASHVPAGE